MPEWKQVLSLRLRRSSTKTRAIGISNICNSFWLCQIYPHKHEPRQRRFISIVILTHLQRTELLVRLFQHRTLPQQYVQFSERWNRLVPPGKCAWLVCRWSKVWISARKLFILLYICSSWFLSGRFYDDTMTSLRSIPNCDPNNYHFKNMTSSKSWSK